jgi:hypothetical protein
MKLYYKIWVDCFVKAREKESNKNSWKSLSMAGMTFAMTANALLFMAILQRDILRISFYHIYLPSQYEKYNGFVEILILFVLPIVIINYLLIFRNKRYEKLIEKYPYHNGKLFATYLTISTFLPIVLLFGGIIITQDVTFWDFFRK